MAPLLREDRKAVDSFFKSSRAPAHPASPEPERATFRGMPGAPVPAVLGPEPECTYVGRCNSSRCPVHGQPAEQAWHVRGKTVELGPAEPTHDAWGEPTPAHMVKPAAPEPSADRETADNYCRALMAAEAKLAAVRDACLKVCPDGRGSVHISTAVLWPFLTSAGPNGGAE